MIDGNVEARIEPNDFGAQGDGNGSLRWLDDAFVGAFDYAIVAVSTLISLAPDG